MKKLILLVIVIASNIVAFAQYATGDNTTAIDFAQILGTADRATRDLTDLPPSWSIKKYAPSPKNQGKYGTCVAWSSAYAARTISYAIQKKQTNTDSINNFTFSPGFLYYKIKSAGDTGCAKGSNIVAAMEVMKSGIVLKKDGPGDCAGLLSDEMEKIKAPLYRIKDFLRLNDSYYGLTKNDIIKIKKSLTENKPVVISLRVHESFNSVGADGLWSPGGIDKYLGGHALCVVGYDDKAAGSGAFEVMNSWGPGWGNRGFFWLTYDQMIAYGNYAVEMMDQEIKTVEKKPEIMGNIEFISLDQKTMPVKRSKVTTRSIIVEDDETADYSLYKFVENYAGGTAFKMKFNTNAPSYMYVFAEDDQSVISRLFPYNKTVSAAINSPNATYFFPSETKHARLSKTPGKENICVLFSKTEIDFEGLMSYISNTKVNIYQAVKDKLADRLLDLKKVKFTDDKISFEAPAEDKSVLCFFIEMEHN